MMQQKYSINEFILCILLFLTMNGLAGIYSISCIIGPELFPTTIRGKVMSYFQVIGRIGPLIVPLLTNIMGFSVNYIFVILGFLTFGITFFLNETLNCPMPDEIPEDLQKEEFLRNVEINGKK